MLFFCAVGMTMIIYSPFVLSNALIGLLSLALFDIQLYPFRISFHPRLRENWRGFWKTAVFWVPSLLFFIVLIGCLYSTDFDYGWERIRLKVPFLVLPFAFYSLPRLRQRSYYGLFYFLVVVLFLTNIGIGINYLLHFEEINEGLQLGRSIPTPRNHIRYSLLLCIGVLAGFILFYQRFHIRHKWESWLILGLTMFNFIFIHILSVRSGLMVLYCSMILGVIALVLIQKKYGLAIGATALIMLLPTLAYHTVPSFKTKLSYANWELHEYRAGRIVTGSDQGRIQSYQVGWEVFSTNPLLGVGAGDLKQAVHDRYDSMFPGQTKKLMPHNQFLSVAAGSGLLGLLIFLIAIFYPFLRHQHFRDPFFFVFFFTFLLSFVVENTIENSIGIGFYCLFLGISLSYLTRLSEVK